MAEKKFKKGKFDDEEYDENQKSKHNRRTRSVTLAIEIADDIDSADVLQPTPVQGELSTEVTVKNKGKGKTPVVPVKEISQENPPVIKKQETVKTASGTSGAVKPTKVEAVVKTAGVTEDKMKTPAGSTSVKPGETKKVETTKVETTKVETTVEPKVETKKVVTKVDPKKEETKVVTKVETKKVEPKVETKKVEPKVETTKVETTVEPKKEETKVVTTVEPKKEETKVVTLADTKKEEPKKEEEKKEEHHKKPTNWLMVAILVVLLLILASCVTGIIVFRNVQLPWQNGANNPAATEAPVAEVTEAPVAEVTESPVAEVTESPVAEETEAPVAEETEAPVITDGKALAEEILGETLPWPVPAYVSGKPGFPEICAGLCWDKSKLDEGILVWYGPSEGSEDITQSDVKFGDGTDSPIELMRSGQINTVIFANGLDAQMEVCAIKGSTLDGKLIADWLKDAGITEQCGRFAIPAGWHVVKDNMNAPIAGFGIRLSATGWASMTEPQIVEYNKYWTIEGKTATWTGPEGVEIMMTPAMVSMMQDFGTLTEVVFTTTEKGTVLFCNGSVTGTINLDSPDGACRVHEIPVGTYTYHGEKRTSAGISWNMIK